MTTDAAVAAQFAGMGVSLPAGWIEEEQPFQVMDTNWSTVAAFLDCGTAWAVTALADGRLVRTGFDWAAVKAVLDMTGRVAAEVFPGLRIMEGEALDAFAAGQ